MFDYVLILFLLIFFHYLADYPLQGEFLSRAKNRFNPVSGVPWYHAMAAHAFIHAALVYIATGYFIYFVIEFAAHWYFDDRKCSGEITFNGDQIAHLSMKLCYVVAIIVNDVIVRHTF